MAHALPPIVSRAEWQAARDRLLEKEKAHTRAGDALSPCCHGRRAGGP
jgi:predicted dithiol-disulfide oxidoreductase (DUF899 family)